MKLMSHSRRQGWASLASVSRQVEGLGDARMGHLVVTAAGFDGGACLENQATCLTNFDRGHESEGVQLGGDALCLSSGAATVCIIPDPSDEAALDSVAFGAVDSSSGQEAIQ